MGTVFNIAINIAQARYCIDISAFDGVSFWAKAATDAATVEVNFVIPATNATKDGGDCLSGCYDHPRKAVTLTADWKQYNSAKMNMRLTRNRSQGARLPSPIRGICKEPRNEPCLPDRFASAGARLCDTGHHRLFSAR